MLKLPGLVKYQSEDKVRIIDSLRLATYGAFLCSFVQGLNVRIYIICDVISHTEREEGRLLRLEEPRISCLREHRKTLAGTCLWQDAFRSGVRAASFGVAT